MPRSKRFSTRTRASETRRVDDMWCATATFRRGRSTRDRSRGREDATRARPQLLHRGLRGQIPEGGGMPGEGSGRVVELL